MIPVVGFGAGGHAKVVIEILRSMQEYKIVGLLETQDALWGTSVLGVEVLGDDSSMAELKQRGIGVLITDHNVRETLDIVDRACIIYDGQVLFQGTPEALVADSEVRRLYLGETFAL